VTVLLVSKEEAVREEYVSFPVRTEDSVYREIHAGVSLVTMGLTVNSVNVWFPV